MLIIETPIFTQRIHQFLSDEQYRLLQQQLVTKPDSGRVIPGSGGLRKMRWSVSGRGKRGGIRIIYYWAVARGQILMLFVYPKSEQDDLTPMQLRALKRIMDEEYP
jgi:mRNA-degrading endonuclease RelE of RelBE toxin-antitoxin system